MTLVACGTRVLFGARAAPYATSETELAGEVTAAQLASGMLCLADRQFCGCDLWQHAVSTDEFTTHLRGSNVDLRSRTSHDAPTGCYDAGCAESRSNGLPARPHAGGLDNLLSKNLTSRSMYTNVRKYRCQFLFMAWAPNA